MSSTQTEYSEPLFAVIVGSGFSGLCIAIKMKLAGYSYCLLEQAESIGGTWRDNTYPGAACDVPSNLYCFSFAANPNWSRSYPQQAEIESYMNHCADRFSVREHMQFNQRVSAARFDEATKRWHIETNEGKHRYEARCLIIATGGLSRPQMPSIEGMDQFKGELFHTARWNHQVSLHGKRVGLIGTGASAIQVAPAISDAVSQLTIFQRTPPWLIFKPDFAISNWHRWLRNKIPLLQKINRAYTYAWHESWAVAFTRLPLLLKCIQPFSRLFLYLNVNNAAIRKKLMPEYVIGCKRVLLSNHYLKLFNRKNVELIDKPIQKINANGILTNDGVEHPLDVIVACTGFHAAEAGVPFPVYGLKQAELNADWQAKGGASAYLGTMVSGFPNLFLMSGPNTALGHNSMIYIIESQASYVMSAMQQLKPSLHIAFNVNEKRQHDYNLALQQRLSKTVWNTGGCSSWYLASNGLNTTLWPDFTFVYRQKTRSFNVADCEVLGALT